MVIKVFVAISIIVIFISLLFQIDEKNGWMNSFKRWIRSKLGLCNHFKEIVYEEEYSKEGEPYYHHTYRITRCVHCGKIFRREQLQ